MSDGVPTWKKSTPRCACGKISHASRHDARQFDALFNAERRRPYRCDISGRWHLGRLTQLRKHGVDVNKNDVSHHHFISKNFPDCVASLVHNELAFQPRLYRIAVCAAEYIARMQRTEGRDVTVTELGCNLPDDYLQLVEEPDEDWTGTARQWLGAVKRATIQKLATEGLLVIEQGSWRVQIGPRFGELIDRPTAA